MEKTDKKLTLKQFYFTSSWHTLFTTSYLFLFIYFAIAYLDNIFSAIGFVFHTFSASTVLIPVSHIFWGAVYVISLILPFTVSIFAIYALPNLWRRPQWKKDQKLLGTIALLIIVFGVMLVASDLISTVRELDILSSFL